MFSQAVLQCFVVKLRWLCADGACVPIVLSRYKKINSLKFYGQIKPSLWWVYCSAVSLLQLLWLFVVGFEREPHSTVPLRLHMLHISKASAGLAVSAEWLCCGSGVSLVGVGQGLRESWWREWGTASTRVVNEPPISWATRKGDQLGQLWVEGLKNFKKFGRSHHIIMKIWKITLYCKEKTKLCILAALFQEHLHFIPQ